MLGRRFEVWGVAVALAVLALALALGVRDGWRGVVGAAAGIAALATVPPRGTAGIRPATRTT